MATMTSPSIAFDDVGQGSPALLFLPGWCGGREVFHDVLAAAGRNRRAVALDWRGHGESERLTGDFGFDDLVADALRVVEEAGVERLVPVGLAHAGWVAIELRRRLGAERVPALVLIDWMVLGPPPGFLDALAAMQQPQSWEAVRGQLFGMWTTGVGEQAVHDYVASMAGYGFDMWSRASREIIRGFTSDAVPLEALARMQPPCPTLHLYAQPRDDAFLDAQRAFAADHPWFAVRRLDAQSHFPTLEVPDQIAEAIEDHIRQAR